MAHNLVVPMRTGLFVVAAAFLSAAVNHAQAPQPRIWQGVYTTTQAERGRAAYTTSCLRCHNADLSGDRGPALKGERFMTTWGGGGVDRVFAKIRDTMPPFATSTLDDATKLDIVTFILQNNGFPAANRELAAGDLESIQIVAKGQQPALQNFSRVHVVGCLARGEENGWVLTAASEPAVATDTGPGAVPPAPGRGRVVLINAGQFDPATQVGQRVEARGLLYRDDRETLVALSALIRLGPCEN
jgi:mono/diheme cytochrome c family protein